MKQQHLCASTVREARIRIIIAFGALLLLAHEHVGAQASDLYLEHRLQKLLPQLKTTQPFPEAHTFLSYNDWTFDHATCQTWHSDGLKSLTDSSTVVLYFKTAVDAKPSAAYVGEMDNGRANGFGTFFLANNFPEGTVSERQGFWQNGVFMQEKESEAMMAYMLKEFDPELKFNITIPKEANVQAMWVSFSQDPLVPDLTNGYNAMTLVTWVQANSIHYFILGCSQNDYMSERKVDLVKCDKGLRDRYDGYLSFPSGAIPHVVTFGLGGYMEGERLIDATTMVKRKGLYGYQFCGWDAPVRSGIVDVEVNFRSDERDAWRYAGTWQLIRYGSCTAATRFSTSTAYGSGRKRGSIDPEKALRHYFTSEDEAFMDIVTEARSQATGTDSTQRAHIRLKEAIAEVKMDLLIERLSTPGSLLRFNPTDTLVGFWSEPGTLDHYCIISPTIQGMFNERDDLYYNRMPYGKGLKDISGGLVTRTLKTVDRSDQPWRIRSLERDRIVFENGRTWVRH